MIKPVILCCTILVSLNCFGDDGDKPTPRARYASQEVDDSGDPKRTKDLYAVKIFKKQSIADNTLRVFFEAVDARLTKEIKEGAFFKFYLGKGEDGVYKHVDENKNDTYFRRSYSLSSTPEKIQEEGIFSIDISLHRLPYRSTTGLGTHFFENVEIDHEVLVDGPHYQLKLPTQDQIEEENIKRLFFMSTGTGTAVFLSMYDYIASIAAKNPAIQSEGALCIRSPLVLYYL